MLLCCSQALSLLQAAMSRATRQVTSSFHRWAPAAHHSCTLHVQQMSCQMHRAVPPVSSHHHQVKCVVRVLQVTTLHRRESHEAYVRGLVPLLPHLHCAPSGQHVLFLVQEIHVEAALPVLVYHHKLQGGPARASWAAC